MNPEEIVGRREGLSLFGSEVVLGVILVLWSLGENVSRMNYEMSLRASESGTSFERE